ncbi:MAG: hypothetical protein AAGK14_14090 [Verrucomicrobiota bacterium]
MCWKRIKTGAWGGALALLLAASPVWAQLSAVDADGERVTLNPKGKTTLVLVGNDEHEEDLRKAASHVDSVRGRPDFRLYVVVDLQDSLGSFAPELVTNQMKENMNNAVPELRKLYALHGNPADPRADMATFADFDGKLVRALGWKGETEDYLRAVVFDRNGKVVERWGELRKQEYPEMAARVNQALGVTPKAVPAAEAVRVAQPVE